jgi:hypothetical protein
VRLNLGCGKLHLPGWVNVDQVEPADCVCNLTEGLPWDDNSVKAIRADNLFEHFDNDEYRFVMNEAWRVLSPKGVMWWKVPNAKDWFDGAAGDPTHKRFFTPRSFYYLNHARSQWRDYGSTYGYQPWKIVTLKLVQNKKFFECTMSPYKE